MGETPLGGAPPATFWSVVETSCLDGEGADAAQNTRTFSDNSPQSGTKQGEPYSPSKSSMNTNPTWAFRDLIQHVQDLQANAIKFFKYIHTAHELGESVRERNHKGGYHIWIIT